MKRIEIVPLLALCIVFSLQPSYAQVFDDADSAFHESVRTGKPILLIFSGSDWCAPCIQLEKRILSEKTFTTFANEQLILLKADFPQRKKISKNLREQNESLAERYNSQGVFPFVVLLNPDGSVQRVLTRHTQTPVEFIDEIRPHLYRIKNGKT